MGTRKKGTEATLQQPLWPPNSLSPLQSPSTPNPCSKGTHLPQCIHFSQESGFSFLSWSQEKKPLIADAKSLLEDIHVMPACWIDYPANANNGLIWFRIFLTWGLLFVLAFTWFIDLLVCSCSSELYLSSSDAFLFFLYETGCNQSWWLWWYERCLPFFFYETNIVLLGNFSEICRCSWISINYSKSSSSSLLSQN